jgi:hypothetical protein
MVRQTFSRPATYFVTVSEKSIVNPIMRPEYRYTAPTPVGSGVMISRLSFEPHHRHRAAFTHVPREFADIVDIGKHTLGRQPRSRRSG